MALDPPKGWRLHASGLVLQAMSVLKCGGGMNYNPHILTVEPPVFSLCRGLVRQLSIDQLDNEGRRVSIYDKALPEGGKSPMFHRSLSVPGVHKRVINELLRPRQWKPNMEDRHFMLQVSMYSLEMEHRAVLGIKRKAVLGNHYVGKKPISFSGSFWVAEKLQIGTGGSRKSGQKNKLPGTVHRSCEPPGRVGANHKAHLPCLYA